MCTREGGLQGRQHQSNTLITVACCMQNVHCTYICRGGLQGRQQQDSHELLRLLLDGLEREELKARCDASQVCSST